MKLLFVPIILGALLLQIAIADESKEEKDSQESLSDESKESEDSQVENLNIQQASLLDEFNLDLGPIIDDINNNLPEEFRRYSRQILELSQRLQERADRVHQRWATTIENQENLVLSNLNRWVERTSQDLSSYADDYERNRIKEYSQNVSAKVFACADLLNADLQDYEVRIQDLNEIYRNVLSELRNQIEICYRKPTVECKRRITVEVKKLRNGPKDYARLITEGSKLVTSDFEYQACVAKVLEEFKNDSVNFIRSGTTVAQ